MFLSGNKWNEMKWNEMKMYQIKGRVQKKKNHSIISHMAMMASCHDGHANTARLPHLDTAATIIMISKFDLISTLSALPS